MKMDSASQLVRTDLRQLWKVCTEAASHFAHVLALRASFCLPSTCATSDKNRMTLSARKCPKQRTKHGVTKHQSSSRPCVAFGLTRVTLLLLIIHVYIVVLSDVQCHLDQDCANHEKCLDGICVDACLTTQCGLNAQCKSTSHTGICFCSQDFTGNAYIECIRGIYKGKR